MLLRVGVEVVGWVRVGECREKGRTVALVEAVTVRWAVGRGIEWWAAGREGEGDMA